MSKAADFFDLNSEVSLSAGHDRMVVFARRESGELVHISEVDNGKACGCVCLACQEALIARQGAVREHSFAHRSGTQCQHAMDAMLHGVIHRLIERHRHFVTPALRVSASVPGPYGPITDSRLQPAIKVPVDSVALVERLPWRHLCVQADVKGHSVLIHVAVKRPTPGDKCETLAQEHQAAIEMDLTGHGPRTVGDLARLLFGADDRKTWLFNPKAEAIEAELKAALEPLAEQRWSEHHAAEERQRVLQQQRAQALAREQAERQRMLAAKRAADLERQAADVEEQVRLQVDAKPELPSEHLVRRPGKPAELSAAVEYAGPTGRLWLLHSSGSDTDIFIRVEGDLQPALDVLCRCGAVPMGEPGVWRISRGGWSSVSIELSSTWTTIRTVTATPAQ
jgi:hypothetical protein